MQMETDVVYNLENLSTRRPGPVLLAGYGNPLKSIVKAAVKCEVTPLFVTSTEDKMRAFEFGGATTPINIGKKFDPRLFSNENKILTAAEQCEARTILCASNVAITQLLQDECLRRNILLLFHRDTDKSLNLWQRSMPPGVENTDAAIDSYKQELKEAEWRSCAKCGLASSNDIVVDNGYKCPICGSYSRMTSSERISITFDPGSVEEWDQNVAETNALDFPDFNNIIEKAKGKSGLEEGVKTGKGCIRGIETAFGILEPTFLMGSMGHVVGEKLARMFERATEEGLPAVVFSASGGARMQEGLMSLMQMAKVSAAVQRHSDAKLLYISVLCDPTTGGVTASFATLGDILVSEPGAIIGFAGRRVIQNTIKQTLPDEFQTAEFALEHGLIDMVVARDEMREKIATLLMLHGYNQASSWNHVDRGNAGNGMQIPQVVQEVISDDAKSEKASPGFWASLGELAGVVGHAVSRQADALGHAVSEQAENYNLQRRMRKQGVADHPSIKPSTANSDKNNTSWQSVQLARNVKRPTATYYIDVLFDDFVELHGDRAFADDSAIVGGIGRIGDTVVTVVAQEKGSDVKEKVARNFGCPQPEGYRKALRLMAEAQKFNRPIVCLVDTQGAFCGKEAEERGMGNAIAESLAFMSDLEVPVISVLLGEGGSGGALALAVANSVAMLENSMYSVLSPEGFAAILWKDGARAPEAAAVMKLTAADALSMGLIEEVIPEGDGPAHENPEQAAAAVWLYITSTLSELLKLTPAQLRQQRYDRFRKF